ncbi:RHS repeat domain-containing protein [Aestuariibius insulae]|uniref:RHS repeat domain-containing protein n=1 Tax=Aestuariibius insulae TaxID=2058287 RepID=UPI00345EFEB4
MGRRSDRGGAPVYSDGTIAWDCSEAWIYEPGSFIPVAKVAGEQLWYVTIDHLGTPRELFSEDGQTVAWRADPGLWGKAEPELRAANDAHPSASCLIRFQGQWEDEESGLRHNRFRYHDPEATQYLSPDPIGLVGEVEGCE